MSTINSIGGGVNLATEGQNQSSQIKVEAPKVVPTKPLVNSAEKVTENLKMSKEAMELKAQDLQRLSNMLPNNKLEFSVNEDINRIVITVLDKNTKEVIRMIPSEEIQNFEMRLKEQIGVIFDEVI